MKKLKDLDVKIIAIIIVAIVCWIPISTTVQRFKCPSLTETELFLRIGRSFILDFKDC